jgi:hypothetical protein
VLVFGGAVVDIVGRVTAPITHLGSSNPGKTTTSYGGVAFNIAGTMAHIFASNASGGGGNDDNAYKVILATAIADDSVGRDLKQTAEQMGVDMSYARVVKTAANSQATTATYTALYDNSGDLRIAGKRWLVAMGCVALRCDVLRCVALHCDVALRCTALCGVALLSCDALCCAVLRFDALRYCLCIMLFSFMALNFVRSDSLRCNNCAALLLRCVALLFDALGCITLGIAAALCCAAMRCDAMRCDALQ